jgi:hypothetical protein
MSASSETKVPLHVVAADAATEIFLVDARLGRQDRAVGELRTRVAPGLYKLRFRSAQTQVDRLIEVPLDGLHRVEAPPIPFATAMPLDDTADLNPAHQQIVREATSNPAERTLGVGSKLCLFVRDLPEDESQSVWSGLGVHNLDGGLIAEISDAQKGSLPGIAALSLDLDPGPYRIRVSPANAPAHEIFVPLVRGWQTQVFTLSDEPSAPDLPRTPRLRDASVCMARLGAMFDPGDSRLRLAELLRCGLESGRAILTDTVLAQVLGAGGGNPMLDIFVGHLMIRERPIKQRAIAQILERARQLVGELPDVTALLLRPGSERAPRTLRFETPPLLRSSWSLIVAASRRRMSLVPQASVTAQVGERLVTHPLWLISGRVDASPDSSDRVMSFAAASRLLDRLIAVRPDQLDAKRRQDIARVMATASPLERSLLNTTLMQPVPGRAEPEGSSGYSVSAALKRIQAPSYSIVRSVQSLKDKLDI